MIDLLKTNGESPLSAEEKGIAFLKRLYGVTCCSPVTAGTEVDVIKDGRAAGAIRWEHDLRREIGDRGLENVKVFVPNRTPWEIGAASIIKSSSKQDAAYQFLELLLTEEIAQVNMREGRRYPTLLSVEEIPEMERWEDLPVLETAPCRGQPYRTVLELAKEAMPFRDAQSCTNPQSCPLRR